MGIDWQVEPGLLGYETGLAGMEARAEAIIAGTARERIWLVEHPPLYTAGTSAQADDLLAPRFPVHVTGRGGQYTYHGPGQRVVYLNLDLGKRGKDVRRFVQALEDWMIAALADLGVPAWTAAGRIGVWTRGPDGGEAKIGAIGVRVRKWVTLHGLSINVAPDLSHYDGIVPCGLRAFGVTSLADLGLPAEMATLDAALAGRAPAMLSSIETGTSAAMHSGT
ncbi:lipoyl(octanoyl) transferase LipB [Sphingobium sp. H33]|uniref:Octanoyltransferase n=2 Tax=Sphingobium nicotianae TaxID=2782607 RepID=A0A9X1DFI4_9SPHN|nr:lipoyl(octanoyl) transferase LipB [Sphingobium nicotianae]